MVSLPFKKKSIFPYGFNYRQWNRTFYLSAGSDSLKTTTTHKGPFKPKVNSRLKDIRNERTSSNTSVPPSPKGTRWTLFLQSLSHVILWIQPPLPPDLYSHFQAAKRNSLIEARMRKEMSQEREEANKATRSITQVVGRTK